MPNLFLTNYKLLLEIGTAYNGGMWTYSPLAEGIDNVSIAWNDAVNQYQFLSQNGWGQSHVTGAAPIVTVSGRRILGDAAQDYIAGCKVAFDTQRDSSLRVSYVDASSGVDVTPIFTVPCTFVNIVDIGGGASTDDSVFSVDIHTKGQPRFENVAPLPALTVVSVAGTTTGTTDIYVNPALTGSNTYEYITGASVVLPELGADPGSNWTAWNGTDAISATNGNKIGIVEVDSSGFAVKGGIATVTSA